jgi:hypothetical protein
VLQAERRVLKVDHCQAGGGLTRAWGFPEELHRAAALHHVHSSADPGVNLVRLACCFTQALGYRAAPLVVHPGLEALLTELPHLADKVPAIRERLQAEVGAASPQPATAAL